MTVSENSLNAMRAFRHRNDGGASQMTKKAAPDHHPTSVQQIEGARAFASWFAQQRKERGIVMSTSSMLDVQPSLLSQFSIGLHDMRYFVAIPDSCKVWFRSLPWMHVAVSRNSSVLSLVCDRTVTHEITLPEFSMNFPVACEGVTRMLTNYHYLDVRVITGAPIAGPSGSRQIMVGREVFMTMEIRVTSGDADFDDLLDSRTISGGAGHTKPRPGALVRSHLTLPASDLATAATS